MTIVDDQQAQAEALAVSTAVQVAAIYAALQASQITAAEAEALIAAAVNFANAAAVTLADAFLSAQIEQAAGIPTPTTGVAPVDDVDRLIDAARTILADPQPEGTEMRLERLARSEPLETLQRTSVDAMAAQPLVEGWTRNMDADPCQLCRWWWREGRIWPKEHPFQHHKGCACTPRPVLARDIQSTEFTRRLERNARAS